MNRHRRRRETPTPPTPGDTGEPRRPALAWAELLRLPALFTVPGDALAGVAATAARPDSRTLLAIGSSLCLYEAGMALNDWADRAEDAVERPHRPLPSGRVHPAAALTAACALTGAGLALAACAGRPALTVAAPLAAAVWAYDLALKHTPAGPAAMATARALDLLLGAAATTGHTREALPSAALLGTHTLAVTTVSRQETRSGSPMAPLAALTTTALLSRLLTRRPTASAAGGGSAAAHALPGPWRDDALAVAGRGRRRSGGPGPTSGTGLPGTLPLAFEHGTSAAAPATAARRRVPVLGQARPPARALCMALAATYAATAGRPYFHATLNPSPPLTQRAVGGGIRATIPLQAALSARSGAALTALCVAGLAPLGRRFGRKVSVT
ncbi:SCO3242 family prenyltransferase [Streptomyces sp. UG1]|uniref:SCO3242 family prenyltransferase n=1 Tax=Streptomyces sp. UG1 TaxID=3417652 RepID=UPI003CFAD15F